MEVPLLLKKENCGDVLESEKSIGLDVATIDEEFIFPLNTASLKVILEEFYTLYNPERKSTISIIIEKYENNQFELFKSLKERYSISEYRPFDDIIRKVESAPNHSLTIADTTTPSINGGNRQQPQLSNNSNTGIGGLSAAISLNMQDIAGVSSNLLAGTAGRLFNGVSWGITSNTHSVNINSNINANSPSAKSKSAVENLEVKANKSSSADSSEAVTTTGTAEADLNIPNLLSDRTEDESTSETGANKKLKIQLVTVMKENSLLKNESVELKGKVDTLQKSLLDLLDRESETRKESLRLREQLSNCEEANIKLMKQSASEGGKTSRKHAQLLECMQMNQRLTSQLEFLVVEVYRSSNFPFQMRQSSQDASFTLGRVEEDRSSTAANFKQLFYSAATGDLPSPPPPCETSGTAGGQQEGECDTEEATNHDNLTEELSLARKRENQMHSSYVVSKLEIARAAQKEQETSQAMLLQQAEIELLLKKLSTAAGEKENLLQQIAELRHESQIDKECLAESQRRLAATEKSYDNMKTELTASSNRCRQVSEQLSLVEESTRQLREGCNTIVRSNEDKCARLVRCMQERFSLEREEFFSHVRELSEVRSALLGQVQQETNADLQRLRDEAFRARRAEVQKDRQISFLQSQLKEAAGRLASSSADVISESQQEKGWVS